MTPHPPSSFVERGRPPVLGSAITRIAAAVGALIVVVAGSLVVAPTVAQAAGPSLSGSSAPLPPGAPAGSQVQLVSTACPAPGNCVAVGVYGTMAQSFGLIETESGGSWIPSQAPAIPGNVNEALLAVACTSVGNCTATAEYEDGVTTNTLGAVVTEVNGTWTTATPLTTPPGGASNPQVILSSITCPSATSCVAVGSYHSATASNMLGLLATQSGGAWSAIQAPVPSNAVSPTNLSIGQVACSSPGACEAVGEYHGPATSNGLILTLSGGTWQAAESPVPQDANAGQAAFLSAVSCPTGGPCTAVGNFENTTLSAVPFAVSLNGGAAAPTEMGLPSNAAATNNGPLLGISCPTAAYCVAVGGFTPNTATNLVPLVETFSGGSWTARQAPGSFDPTSTTLLAGVSCSWPGSCSAFGLSTTSSPTSSTGVVETLSNGGWSEQSAVLPPDAASPPQVQITGFGGPFLFTIGTPVTCTGGSCALAGSYETMSSNLAGLLNWSPNLTGYQLVAQDGGLFSYNAPFYGSMGGQHLNKPVVGMAVVPDAGGYYQVASDGGIFAFNAPFQGSMGSQPLNAPIVGIAFDSLTGGYYEVASDGGIFAFNAPFSGSMGGQHLNKPIVGMAFDPATGGYYEVASDGGIFAFNAPFQGSTGAITLNKPMVGMSVNLSTGGYYEVASDGGIFAYNAPFQGSMGGTHLNKPVVGMATDFITGGYYEVASDGGIFSFNAPFQGSAGNLTLNQPVVGMGFG